MNLIQQALYEYIIDKDYNDKMLQYNALLDYLFEDLLVEKDKNSGPTATSLQEILTCIFFHAYFNLNQKFENVEELVNWYKSKGQKIIEKINDNGINKNSLNTFFNSGTNINKKTSYTDWQLSWYNQCKSFENSEFAQKNKTNLTFIHHDTGFIINNEKADFSNKDAGIVKRVDDGWKINFKDIICKSIPYITPATIKKDQYQKADIYVITENGKNALAENNIDNNTIDDEILFWINALNNEFIGISLKKLKTVVQHPHIFTTNQPSNNKEVKKLYDDQMNSIKIQLSDNGAYINFNPEIRLFDCKNINEIINNSTDIGKITTNFVFSINLNGEDRKMQVAVRSNGHGDDHALYKPMDSFNCQTTTELKYVDGAADAQAGKVASLVQMWAKEAVLNLKFDLKDNSSNFADSDDYEKIIDKITENLGNIAGFNGLSDAAKNNINTIHNNIKNIINLYNEIGTDKRFTKSHKISFKEITKNIKNQLIDLSNYFIFLKNINDDNSLQESLKRLYALTKWYNVSWTIICNLYGIIINLGSNGEGCKELFKAAKLSTLPYVSLD